MLIETDRNVYLLAYQSRFGLAITAYTTKAAMEASAAEAVAAIRGEYGVDPSISDLDAAKRWKELTGGKEEFSFQEDKIKQLVK